MMMAMEASPPIVPPPRSGRLWTAMQHPDKDFFCDVGHIKSECQSFIDDRIDEGLVLEPIGEMQSFSHKNYFG